MNPSPLAQMQPIILPPDPSIWPLAIGWWLLAILIIVILVVAIRALVTYRRFWACRNSNLKQAKITTDPDLLNQLLKQTALHYYPRQQVAKLSGQAWSNFLKHSLSTELHQECDAICLSLYRAPTLNHSSNFQRITLAWLANLTTKTIKGNTDDRI